MKIIVFDDDPTGSQTVYGCPLLLKWDKEILCKGLEDKSPLLFLLTNTRALSPSEAELRLREICQSLKQVLKDKKINLQDIFFISRGDSTLRGHWVLEPRILHEEFGPFDATFHIPAFFEGGRTTSGDIHFLNGIPVHQTIFGKDRIFGYSTSDLSIWLEEKSDGGINSKDVLSISLSQLELAHENSTEMNNLTHYLSSLSANRHVIINAIFPMHLISFAKAIQQLNNKHKFLFRCGASFINSLSGILPETNKIQDFSNLKLKDKAGTPKPGLVIVGSHVELADQQLEVLLQEESCIGVELPVRKIARILYGPTPDLLISDLEILWFKKLKKIIEIKKTPVLYTTRREISFNSSSERMKFGISLAELMARLSARLANNLGYIISKGGITTYILLSKGLNLSAVTLKGQILPGLSVVCPQDQVFERLPILTFPGNLGNKKTLLKAWEMMDCADRSHLSI